MIGNCCVLKEAENHGIGRLKLAVHHHLPLFFLFVKIFATPESDK